MTSDADRTGSAPMPSTRRAPRGSLPPAELAVLHRTPGRLRVAVTPTHGEGLGELARAAERLVGVERATVGASGKNVVLNFDPAQIDEDTLLTRLALGLSSRLGYCPVRVLQRKQTVDFPTVALAAGATASAGSLLRSVAPTAGVASLVGWVGSLLTLATVGESVLRDLLRGAPRPEGLSLLHLLSRLDGPNRAYGALLTWLLYHGDAVAQRFRGGVSEGVELRPVALRGGVGEDAEGAHFEIVTRPLRARGNADGRLLTPSTIASALIGYLAYALRQEKA